jgi:hypothetical protein
MDSRTFGNLDGRDSLAICIIKVMYVSSQYQELVAVSQMMRKSLQNWFMMGWMGRPNVCNITIVCVRILYCIGQLGLELPLPLVPQPIRVSRVRKAQPLVLLPPPGRRP